MPEYGRPEYKRTWYKHLYDWLERRLQLEGPIKECALYEVSLNLGFDIETKVKVMVVPVKQAAEKK